MNLEFQLSFLIFVSFSQSEYTFKSYKKKQKFILIINQSQLIQTLYFQIYFIT